MKHEQVHRSRDSNRESSRCDESLEINRHSRESENQKNIHIDLSFRN